MYGGAAPPSAPASAVVNRLYPFAFASASLLGGVCWAFSWRGWGLCVDVCAIWRGGRLPPDPGAFLVDDADIESQLEGAGLRGINHTKESITKKRQRNQSHKKKIRDVFWLLHRYKVLGTGT